MFLILPIFIFYSSNYIKKIIIEHNLTEKFFGIKKKDDHEYVIYRKVDPTSFSGHRISHWKKILSNVNSKSSLFGYGPLGDRYLINNSASSGFFYSLASGGYIGFLIYSIICIRSLYLLLFFCFKKNFFDNTILASSCLIIISSLLRTILETGFAIFSIDFTIFALSIFICEENKKNSKIFRLKE